MLLRTGGTWSPCPTRAPVVMWKHLRRKEILKYKNISGQTTLGESKNWVKNLPVGCLYTRSDAEMRSEGEQSGLQEEVVQVDDETQPQRILVVPPRQCSEHDASQTEP